MNRYTLARVTYISLRIWLQTIWADLVYARYEYLQLFFLTMFPVDFGKSINYVLAVFLLVVGIVLYLQNNLSMLLNLLFLVILYCLVFLVLIPTLKGQFNKAEVFVGIVFYSLLIFYFFLPLKYNFLVNDFVFVFLCVGFACIVRGLFILISKKSKLNLKHFYFGLSVFASLLILFVESFLSHRYVQTLILKSKDVYTGNILRLLNSAYSSLSKDDRNLAISLLLGLLPIYLVLLIKKQEKN